jgi:hypothetical protein
MSHQFSSHDVSLDEANISSVARNAIAAPGVCRECGRLMGGREMPAAGAAFHRANLCAILGTQGDLIAYALAKSSALPISETLACACDRKHWLVACDEYDTLGAVACWLALGVTVD